MITYPDCFGGNVKGLKHVLDKHFGDVLGGIHILPFYPSSADRGFAPLTYKEVCSKITIHLINKNTLSNNNIYVYKSSELSLKYNYSLFQKS